MDGFTNKVGQKVKKAARDEGMEVLKSAKKQVVGDEGIEKSIAQGQGQSAQDQAYQIKKAEEEAKMKKWERQRLSELEEELKIEEEKRSRETEEWRKKQEELMNADKKDEEEKGVPINIPSSPRKGMSRVEKKQRKVEIGRGASG